MADKEHEIKELVIDALMLEDMTPEELDANEPLFVEGLGLDSIDALELAIAIEQKYGIDIKVGEDEKRRIFSTVHELASYVSQQLAA